MSQLPRTLSDIVADIKTQVKPYTPVAIINIIATQTQIAEEARGRIEREGQVVRDLRGNVLAHPALKIEQDAQKIVLAEMKQWRK